MIQLDSEIVSDIAALEGIYGVPAAASIKKEVSYIHPHYRKFIEAAPFALLATSGSDGLDVSPRGDPAGFVRVHDEFTLLLPDRRGNNRIDSLRNILHDSRVSLIFLIPGIGETLRVNGAASIQVDPGLLSTFSIDGKLPLSVLVVKVNVFPVLTRDPSFASLGPVQASQSSGPAEPWNHPGGFESGRN